MFLGSVKPQIRSTHYLFSISPSFHFLCGGKFRNLTSVLLDWQTWSTGKQKPGQHKCSLSLVGDGKIPPSPFGCYGWSNNLNNIRQVNWRKPTKFNTYEWRICISMKISKHHQAKRVMYVFLHQGEVGRGLDLQRERWEFTGIWKGLMFCKQMFWGHLETMNFVSKRGLWSTGPC